MMNWDAMGAIGEVVGAAGVLITLGFLLHQLRLNTRALQTETFRSTAVMIHHPTSIMIQNPDLMDIHGRGNEDYESLDPLEKERYHYLIIQRVHAVELLDYYDAAGLAADSFTQAGQAIVIRLAAKPGFQQWWAERGSRTFGSKFTAWTQSLVDANRA